MRMLLWHGSLNEIRRQTCSHFKWNDCFIYITQFLYIGIVISNNFLSIADRETQIIRFQFSISWSQHWKHPGFCSNNFHLEIELCARTVSDIFLLSQPNSMALKNINHHISATNNFIIHSFQNFSWWKAFFIFFHFHLINRALPQ